MSVVEGFMLECLGLKCQLLKVVYVGVSRVKVSVVEGCYVGVSRVKVSVVEGFMLECLGLKCCYVLVCQLLKGLCWSVKG